MFSGMVHDGGPEGRMSEQSAVSNAMLMLFAGHESTVNLISHCVLSAAAEPRPLELLRQQPRADRARRRGGPALRVLGPVLSQPGSARRHRDRGDDHPAGLADLPVYGSANRDPQRFANADKLDPSAPTTSTSAGASGIHTCFGGPLARLEVNIAFEAFFRRVENPRLVEDPPPYRRSQSSAARSTCLLDIDGIRD